MRAARPSSCACRSRTRPTSRSPEGISDEKLLFLSDVFPTGWQGAVQCDIQPTDTVAIWGCGAVGQMAIRSALLLGAKRVIAIDRVPERLQMAEAGGAEVIDYDAEPNIVGRLNDMTDGRGRKNASTRSGSRRTPWALSTPSTTGPSRRCCWRPTAPTCCAR